MAIRDRPVFTRNRESSRAECFNVTNSVRSSKESQMHVDTYQSCSAAQNDCSWYLFHDKLPQNMMLLEKKWSTLRNTQVTQLSQQLAAVTQAYVCKNPHWTFVFGMRITAWKSVATKASRLLRSLGSCLSSHHPDEEVDSWAYKS